MRRIVEGIVDAIEAGVENADHNAGAGITALLLSVNRAALAWNYRCDNSSWLEWLSPVVNLSRVWPGFFWNESRFPMHAVVWIGLAAATWLLVRRLIAAPRAAVAVWTLVTISLLAPAGWALTEARSLDPTPAQLQVIRGEGQGARVYRISSGQMSRVRSLKDTMRLVPLER
ncbi:MAG: hypothetical protein WCO75_11645, partial [Planctomycetota bacterium]